MLKSYRSKMTVISKDIVIKTENVLTQLLLICQWPHGIWCTWEHHLANNWFAIIHHWQNTFSVSLTTCIYKFTSKCHSQTIPLPKSTQGWKQRSIIKQLLEAVIFAIKMRTSITSNDEHGVTSKPSQSSSRRVSSFKDSSGLLNMWDMWSSFKSS